MKYEVRTSDGHKSVDRKIKQLVAYVNGQIDVANNASWYEEERTRWACEVIRQGMTNIIADCYPERVE